MSGNLYQIFQDIENKGRVLQNYWTSFYTEISQHLPESYQPEMAELSQNLEFALNHLVDELHHPTLTLATTGTTSSGKSTLVNFLCGAEIVPVAVAEMSAGAVTIEWDRQTSLRIEETPGATWECGEWHNVSDQEIYQRLNKVMREHIDQRGQGNFIACPIFQVRYPFRLKNGLDLELPSGTKVKILDLPGLAYVGDEGNAAVIRQCREALCLVTYNSAETDDRRVENLLQEVVQQVKELGGSPARMLFVLNRIDVFRADQDWPDSESRFVEKTTQGIKHKLIDQLQEHKGVIEQLEVIKLSTWPALLAIQVKHPDLLESTTACKKADNHFNGLIEDILEDLPRKQERWSGHDRNRVAEALREKSYAQAFEQRLKDHITVHFPQLVIPQMIEGFNVHAGNAVAEWAVQTTSAILHSSQEEYDQECQRIEEIRSSLDAFLEQSDLNLRSPFEKVDEKFKQVLSGEATDDEAVRYLESVVKAELQQVDPYQELGDQLYPIYGWSRDLGKGINQVLELIAESLRSGKISLNDPYFKQANPLQVNLLERNLSRLIDLGYTGSVAKNGEDRIAKTDIEKTQLKNLNDALNELAINLSIVMQDILGKICEQSGDRIYESVNELFKFHLHYIEDSASDISPEMGIKFPESQLVKLNRKPEFTVRFHAGFAISSGTWEEAVQVSYEERIWWTLFISKRTKYKTEYEPRSSNNATIPSVVNLLKSWILQAKDAEGKIVAQTLSWLLEQISILKKNIHDVQNEIIDRYQTRLEKAHQEITMDYERKKNIWEPLYHQALLLENEFSSLKIDK